MRRRAKAANPLGFENSVTAGVVSGPARAGVAAGSPAADVGLEAGDVILAAAGERVAVIEDLYAALRQRDPGDELRLTLLRVGARVTVSPTVAELPSSEVSGGPG